MQGSSGMVGLQAPACKTFTARSVAVGAHQRCSQETRRHPPSPLTLTLVSQMMPLPGLTPQHLAVPPNSHKGFNCLHATRVSVEDQRSSQICRAQGEERRASEQERCPPCMLHARRPQAAVQSCWAQLHMQPCLTQPSHTVPQAPLWRISRRPSLALGPPTTRSVAAGSIAGRQVGLQQCHLESHPWQRSYGQWQLRPAARHQCMANAPPPQPRHAREANCAEHANPTTSPVHPAPSVWGQSSTRPSLPSQARSPIATGGACPIGPQM